MKKRLAEKILSEDEDYKLDEDYSGRFMYGKTTYGVIVPNRDDVGYLKKKYKGLKADNMGLNYIVY